MNATTRTMPREVPGLIRKVLLIDAGLCAAMGVLLILAASPVADMFDLSSAFVRGAGIALLPAAVLILFVAARNQIPGSGVRLVATLNGTWAVASIALLLAGTISPNVAGVAFIIGQALLVAGFAATQWTLARRQLH